MYPALQSPAVRRNSSRVILASGLCVSAALVAAQGGWPALVLAAAQLALAGAIVVRWTSPWPPAWAVLALVVAPVEAVRHWTARLPGACPCARLPHPPPGLWSLTGLAVLVDVGLLALALWLVTAHQPRKMEKSPPL
jgi:hypothetical protein